MLSEFGRQSDANPPQVKRMWLFQNMSLADLKTFRSEHDTWLIPTIPREARCHGTGASKRSGGTSLSAIIGIDTI
jgi:hypothetical protein